MQVSEEEFNEWRRHPVSEWVFGLVAKFADAQQAKVAQAAWQSGVADQAMLDEARFRADCYRGLSDSSFQDWKAIDDTDA